MVVNWIILFNIIIFILWNFFTNELPFVMESHFLVSWRSIISGKIWTLLTSVFSHNNFFHLFFNMYVLKSFGSIVEQVLGKRRFLIFYLLAGMVASFGHSFVSLFFLSSPNLPALGASGAISGIILIFCLLFPREKILIFGLIPMPAIFASFLFIGIDLWGLMSQIKGGGFSIGHGAHLSGALVGILYYFFFLKNRFR